MLASFLTHAIIAPFLLMLIMHVARRYVRERVRPNERREVQHGEVTVKRCMRKWRDAVSSEKNLDE
jgi:hypothetical protein